METGIAGVVVGLAVGMIGEDILNGIGKAFRPLAKEVIKGGIYVYDSMANLVSETSEHFSDLVAEAKAELAEKDSGEKVKRSAKEK